MKSLKQRLEVAPQPRQIAFMSAVKATATLHNSYGDKLFLASFVGSWSYGNPHLESDIDLVIIIDGEPVRIDRSKLDARLDISTNHLSSLPERFKDAEQFGLVEMLALGDPIYYNPVGEQLLVEARALYSARLPRLEAMAALDLSQTLRSRLKIAQASESSDPSSQHMTICYAVFAACQTQLRIQRTWRGKPHQYLSRIEACSPTMAQNMREALDASLPFPRRIDILRREIRRMNVALQIIAQSTFEFKS